MSFAQTYTREVLSRLEEIARQDSEKIEQAAALLYEAETAGHRIYTFGTGHSHMIGQDIYARAGGYAKIYPILEPELTLANHPTKSTYIERTAAFADVLESVYHLKAGDVVIAASNSGRNALVVEYLTRLKNAGVKIIAITAMAHSTAIESRHASGKKLYELADVWLDNRAPYGDATVALNENTAMGPVSTLTSCFLSQLIVGAFVEKLLAAGKEAPVFRSGNMDGADAYNENLFDQFVYRTSRYYS